MQTADADVIQMNKSPASVTFNNYGTLTSLNASLGGSQAIDFNAILSGSNTVNNYSTGLIQASEADAIRPGVNGAVNNDGTIKSTSTTGSSSDGIDAQTNSGVTIVNAASAGSGTGTGLIEGARHGITGGNTSLDSNGVPNVNNGAYTMSITNNLGGTIQGDNGAGINIDGVNANEVVTIVNHGTITGTGVTADGDGIDVDGVVNLTNTGTIRSLNALNDTSEGVTVGGGTITNSGTIEGSISSPTGNTGTGRGITIAGVDKQTINSVDITIPIQAPYAATTITNQTGGLIKGDSDSGIAFTSALSSGFSHTITNQAGATIQGGGATAPAIVTAADNVTINNAGTIDGSSSGKAITGGSGGLVVNITGASASVLGDITGAAGAANTMTISAGAGNSFSYASTIANFTTVSVLSGSFALNGQLSLAFNGPTAGSASGYGQLVFNSAETFTLGNGSVLNLSLGFTPTVGEQFTLIDMVNGSTVINGAFGNLADGSTYTQSGISYLVSYEGGTGNDLVLTVTAIPEPATTAMIFAGLAGGIACVLRRRRAVAPPEQKIAGV
ncbi:MAG: PEP-CTERM sorting domain-containing protein [Verrucomicrobia bacterium]|nr:PEP-CTERM sorting domain-containing protein [Verrucomicrobiota bacterium]